MTSKSWQFGRHPVNWRVNSENMREKEEYVLCVCVCVCVLERRPKRMKKGGCPTTHLFPQVSNTTNDKPLHPGCEFLFWQA